MLIRLSPQHTELQNETFLPASDITCKVVNLLKTKPGGTFMMHLMRTQVLQAMHEKGHTCCSQEKTWIFPQTYSKKGLFLIQAFS
jgi:hypothetical protein